MSSNNAANSAANNAADDAANSAANGFPEASRRWHHRPEHIFVPGVMYMITASTLHKAHYFRQDERLPILQDALFQVLDIYHWRLQAWAVFSNHYHVIARSPEAGDAPERPEETQANAPNDYRESTPEDSEQRPSSLKPMIQRLHSQTARAVNRLDGVQGAGRSGFNTGIPA